MLFACFQRKAPKAMDMGMDVVCGNQGYDMTDSMSSTTM